MFHKSKLFFWTCEVLLLTIIFYIWGSMGSLISPFVSVLNTIILPFFDCWFLVLYHQSNRRVFGKEISSESNLGHSINSGNPFWIDYLWDCLYPAYFDQPVDKLD